MGTAGFGINGAGAGFVIGGDIGGFAEGPEFIEGEVGKVGLGA